MKNHDDTAATLEQTVVIAEHSVTVARRAQTGSVRLFSPDGSETLCIDITSDGARLRLARGLAIEIAGPLSLSADTVSIHGRDSVSLSSAGDASICVDGHVTSTSRSNTIATTHGDVKFDANDDVVLMGERVRVNC